MRISPGEHARLRELARDFKCGEAELVRVAVNAACERAGRPRVFRERDERA